MTNPSAGGLKAVNNSGNLKAEDAMDLNMEDNMVEKGSNDDDDRDTTINPPSKIHLEYLDGFRGLLCIIVVIHHFRCGFHPCGIISSSAEWFNDLTMCSTNSSTFAFVAHRCWQVQLLANIYWVWVSSEKLKVLEVLIPTGKW